MKCPHCEHSAKEPPKMRCSNCGQIYERAHIEEFQNLAFLHRWISNQGTRLGDQAESLLEEVESRQNELRSLIGIQIRPAEQVARELALTEGAISRVTSWRKAVDSRFAPTKELNQHLEQRIIYLQAELGERSYDLDAPKHLEVIDFTLDATQAWNTAGYLTDSLATSLIRFLQNERSARVSLLSEKYTQGQAVLRLIPDWTKLGVIGTDFSESLETYLSRQVKIIASELRDPPEESLSLLESIQLALKALPNWTENQNIICQKDEFQTLKAHLQEQRAAIETLIAAEAAKAVRKPVLQPEPIKTTVTPTPIPTPVKVAAKPIAIQAPAKPKPKPVSPPKPQKPPIDWGKVWEKVVQAAISGAFLRGLLYLGAFMIVVSLGILVIRFWDIFPAPVQAIFIFSVPTIFYIAGWFVGGKLKLPQAGGVLTGIGALLIAVDFAAIYQFGELSFNPVYYWLATSLVCTLAYILTAWRMKGVFFDYIALIGGGSVVLALMFTLKLPLHWTIASMTAYALAMIVAASQLWSGGDAWRDTARATRYLPQLVIPISLISILFLSWETGSAAISVAFLLSALSYSLLVWRFQATIFSYPAVGSSIGAIGFGLWALGLQLDWYAAATAAVSTPYMLITQRLGIHFSKDKPAWQENWLPFMIAGIGLLITALLAGLITLFFTYWAGVLALTLISIILVSWAYIFRRPVLIAVSSAFFLLPFSLAVSWWLMDAQNLQWGAWLMAAWAGLAIIYMVAAVLLKRIRHYVVWYLVWAQLLAPVSIFGLYIHQTITSSIPSNIPTLVALVGVILFYLLSAIFHDSGRNRILSTYVLRILPGQLGKSAFIWPLVVLTSIWIAIAWYETSLPEAWLGAALAATGLVYVLLGHYAYRSKTAYRLPWHVWAYVLAAAGVAVAYPERTALASALYIDVILLVAFALVYRRYWEIGMAAALFIWPFQLTLALTPLEIHAYSLAYALLASLGYIPVGIWLRRFGRKFAATHYFIGYAMSVIAAAASLISVFGVYPVSVPSIGLLVLLITSALYIFSLYHFKNRIFAWASALTIALAFWQVLVVLQVPFDFYSVAWIGLGISYMLTERFLRSISVQWIQSFRIPLGFSAVALWLFGLALTALPTINALNGFEINNSFPVISAQLLALSFLFIAAKLYSTKWPLFLEPILAFFPVTLFFIGYAEPFFGLTLTSSQYGIVWSGLGLLHLMLAFFLDSIQERYAHGIYLGGYALAAFAAAWTANNLTIFLWTFGILILIAIGSAVITHFNRHHTWDDFVAILFQDSKGILRNTVRGVFIWITAWLSPIWIVLLLFYIGLTPGFQWLGFGLSALVFIGLAVWTRRLDFTYAWAFQSAAQVFTAAALLISLPSTFGFLAGNLPISNATMTITAAIAIQASAVVFYITWAAIYQQRSFTHLSSWLSFFPYTLAWIAFSSLSSTQFALPWIAWVCLLLITGFILDRLSVRFAHGPYLAGYLLTIFALAWSIPDRLTNLYVLAASILIAFLSHMAVHFGRHHTWDDFIKFIWSKPGTLPRRVAQISFLNFAVYAFPVWLMLLLSYYQVSWAWRGLALVLVAPLYIAFGLALRRIKVEYTWPLFSAGYALTAIGALVSIDDLSLAIYVLGLNTVVYASSAYIFRQPTWLYLSNTLIPIISLMTLQHNNQLIANWVSTIFIVLAFLYFGIGLWLDNRIQRAIKGKQVSSYGLPFYSLCYLLSAISLAVASTERNQAIIIYAAGVALYGLSARTFRVTLFIYPAAWLAAIPYYLVMTILMPETVWYGLGWLPMIIAYILFGRFAFKEKMKLSPISAALEHPAIPFYLLAYALSISMIVLSAGDSLILTLALTAGTGVYILSTIIFQSSLWLYPSLITAHLALLSYFNIHPSGRPSYYVSLPFMIVTWLMALIGYFNSRHLVRHRYSDEEQKIRLIDRIPMITYLRTRTWGQPFLIFAILDLIIWQSVALLGFDTAIIVSLSFAILSGLLSMLWFDNWLSYGSLALSLMAFGVRLAGANLHLSEALAWVSGFGLLIYLIRWLIEQILQVTRSTNHPLAVWLSSLYYGSLFLTTLSAVGTLPFMFSHTTACAAALAFAGVTYLAIALRGRRIRLSYLGSGMLLAAWVMALIFQDVNQPQLYAIPFGLYLASIGYFERQLGRIRFGIFVECFGFSVMLITSFIQSLNGLAGLPYFVLLMAESLGIFWWGAVQHCKIPLFIGIGGSVINVVAQIVILVNVYQVSRWFVTLGVGLALVVVGVIVERKRERILTRTREWREVLEAWN